MSLEARGFVANKGFGCSLYLTTAYRMSHPNVVITLEPILYNPDDPSKSYSLGEAKRFTFGLPDAPEAVVTKNTAYNKEVNLVPVNNILGGGYQYGTVTPNVAYTFEAKDTSEEASSGKYASWKCDYVVSMDADTDAYSIGLFGQYGWGAVAFPSPVDATAGQKIPLLMSVTKNGWEYNSIVAFVRSFTCGAINFSEENIGKTITVSLVMWNESNPVYNSYENAYVVEEIDYRFETVTPLFASLGDGQPTPVVYRKNTADANGFFVGEDGYFVTDGNGNLDVRAFAAGEPHFAMVADNSIAKTSDSSYSTADEAIATVEDNKEITVNVSTSIGSEAAPAGSTVTTTTGTAVTAGTGSTAETTVTPKTVTITSGTGSEQTGKTVEAYVVSQGSGDNKKFSVVTDVSKDETIVSTGKTVVSDFVKPAAVIANAVASENLAADKVSSMVLSLAKTEAESSEPGLDTALVTAIGAADKAFEVHPVATITTTTEEGTTATTSYAVANSELAEDASFTFTLDFGVENAGKLVTLTHYASDGVIKQHNGKDSWTESLDANGLATVTLSEFSYLLGTVLNAFSYNDFVEALYANNGSFDGSAAAYADLPKDENGRLIVRVEPVAGDWTAGSCTAAWATPYRNNDDGIAQLRLFYSTIDARKDKNTTGVTDVTVENVAFVMNAPDSGSVTGQGTFDLSTVNAYQLYLMNDGNVTFDSCEFDGLGLAVFAPEAWAEGSVAGGYTQRDNTTIIKDCSFANIYDYAIKEVNTPNYYVTGTTFENCGCAILVNPLNQGNAGTAAFVGNTFKNIDTDSPWNEKAAGGSGTVKFDIRNAGTELIWGQNTVIGCSGTADDTEYYFRKTSNYVTELKTATDDAHTISYVSGNTAFTTVSPGTVTVNEDGTVRWEQASVAKIGETKYATIDDLLVGLQTAIAGGSYANTITFLADVELADNFEIPQEMAQCPTTFDLNGKHITLATGRTHAIRNSGQITLVDSVGGGSVTAPIPVINESGATFNMQGGTLICNEQGRNAVQNRGTFNMTGGSLQVAYVGSSSDSFGSACLSNSGTATITKGSLTSVNQRAYAIVNSGTLTINPAADSDVAVTGAHGAVAVDGGTVSISGGSYTATNYYALYVSNEASNPTVTVTGGTFDGNAYSAYIGSDVNESVTASVAISGGTFNDPIIESIKVADGSGFAISGGNFTTAVAEGYCATGYIPTAQDSETGMYTVKTGSYVAQIGTTKYESLAEAVAAASVGATVELIADDRVSLTSGDEIVMSKSLTITGPVDATGEPLYTIYGKNTVAGANDIFITGSGTVSLSNLRIAQFGNNATTDAGHAPVYVSTSFTGTVNLDNVYISEFNRGGLFLYGGAFTVTDCYIDCANSRSGSFTKGIEVKGSAHGTIKDTVIVNMERSGDDSTAGIELYGNGSVVVDGCTIISDVDQHQSVKATYGIVSSRVGVHDPSGGSLLVTNCNIDVSNAALSVADNDEYGPVNNYSIVVDGEDTYFCNYIATWSAGSSITINEGEFCEDVYADAGTINITGGKFSTFAPYAGATGALVISGGIFDKEVDEEYCAAGYVCTNNTDEDTLDAYPFAVVPAVASITIDDETTYYATFEDAIDDAELSDEEVTITVINYNETMVAPEGWKFVTENDVTTLVKKVYVAQIGTTKYESLADAIAAVQDGETIQLIADVTDATMGAKGIVASGAKTVTLDLAGFNATCTDGSAASNRMIKIADGLTLNVVNTAETQSVMSVLGDEEPVGGTPATLPYGVFRAEAGTTLNINGGESKNIKLVNGQAWGLNVKLLGATATLSNIEIESTYGGGIEVTEANLGALSQAGYAELTDCTFTQTGYFDHCSTALSVSGGSELVVNSGTYTSENYGLYVFSSGGKITVKGGTITGENKAAVMAAMDTNTYPAYTGAVQISGGKFTGALSVTSPASMSISGGVFTVPVADEYCAEGYEPAENTDADTMAAYPYTVGLLPVAQIGTTKYATLAAAFAAVQDGETIQLIADVTDATMGAKGIVASGAKTVTLDLAGFNATCTDGSAASNRMIKIADGLTLNVVNTAETQSVMSVLGDEEPVGGTPATLPYGVFRAEAGTTLNINGGESKNIKLVNGQAWGLNVKLLGATATLSNIEIESTYGGGIEVTEANLGALSQAGYAELTDCTFTQTGYFDHCSTALSVSGGSELVVNSGTYTSENYGLYVFSSGGKITVKGGTITGENKAAVMAAMDTNTYPAYTGAVQISGGKFTGALSVTSPASMSISGGVFTVPVADGYCAEGYEPADNTDAETKDAYSYMVDRKLEVIAAADGTVELSKDVDSGYTFQKKVGTGEWTTVNEMQVVESESELPASGATQMYHFQFVKSGETAVPVGNTVGILHVADAACDTTTIIGVPWFALGEKITVDSLVYLGNRSAGDQLMAYDAANDCYWTWTLAAGENNSLVWGEGTTVKENVTATAPKASEFELQRGQGLFLTRTDKTKPIYLVGRADGTATATTTLASGTEKKPTWSLLAAPSTTALNLNSSAFKSDTYDKDTIMLPTTGAGVKMVYTYKDGKWGTLTSKTMTIGEKTYYYTVRDTEHATVPAGTGFWFLNKSAAKDVEWTSGGTNVINGND